MCLDLRWEEMVETIDVDMLLKIMKNILKVLEANEKYLTKLDADIGDADHGINMVRGFKLVNERLSSLNNPDISTILNIAGTALLETVGGAAGPLYGMCFIQASESVQGKKEIDKKNLATLCEACLKGVQTVGGGTVPGEKTMVDSLDPAVRVLKESAERKDESLVGSLEKAVKAAREGVQKTIPLVAKRGRASYLGERSVGHQDPGATSTYLILRTILDTLKGKIGVKITKYGSDGAILEETYLTE